VLTQEQLDSFHANGFLIMRGLFQGEELRLLTEAVDRTQAQVRPAKANTIST
jgi:hypothetical protein